MVAIQGGIELGFARGAAGWLARTLAAERERLILWAPVGLGLGIAFYFGLRTEPPAWLGIAVLLPALGLGHRALARGAAAATAAWVGLACMAAGFAAAQFETSHAGTPLLQGRLDHVRLSGRVQEAEPMPAALRLTIAPAGLGDLPQAEWPHLVRVTLHDRMATGPVPQIGDNISAKVTLLPLPAPDLPGGFDFQRQSYFRGLGAVGYFNEPPIVAAGPAHGLAGRVARLRQAMTARILAGLPGSEGTVAAALITGQRAAIPVDVAGDFRNSGLAHLLVIAGLHMSLLTGCAFFLIRAGLALVPNVALRYPIKKWAAGVALILAAFYLVISGSAVPTQRAFAMCALALGAILFDRQLFSMRALAIAAALVLLMQPVALEGVSFQMSFAAVVCLIAFYETAGRGMMAAGMEAGPVRRAGLHLAGVALTTLVATLGTAPFAVFHFGRLAWFSVLANVAAVPVTAFWIIPWGLVACLLMPLHLERLGLMPMGWGIRLVEAIGHWAANLPHAVLLLATPPAWAMVSVTAGGLWLCLWRQNWRYAGLAAIVAGIAGLGFATPPDLLVSPDGTRIGAQGADGRLYLLPYRPDDFIAQVWLENEGDSATAPLPYRGDIPLPAGKLSCYRLLCTVTAGGNSVAIARFKLWPDEDCPQAGLLISLAPLPDRCAGTPALDPGSAAGRGATAIWLNPTPHYLAAAPLRGNRPWVVRDSGDDGPP